MTTRRFTCVALLGVGAALLAGAGCSDDGGGEPAASMSEPAPTTSTTDTGSGSSGSGSSGSGAAARELGTYTTEQGLTRVYVLVESDISDEELVDLARMLHTDEPDVATFFFMDDDARIDDVLAALPETERGDRSNWPADWVTDHTVAALALFIFPEEPTRRWVLGRGLSPHPEDALAVIE